MTLALFDKRYYFPFLNFLCKHKLYNTCIWYPLLASSCLISCLGWLLSQSDTHNCKQNISSLKNILSSFDSNQVLIYISVQVEGIQVHADEGGTTQTRGGVYCFILPAGCRVFYPWPVFYLVVQLAFVRHGFFKRLNVIGFFHPICSY